MNRYIKAAMLVAALVLIVGVTAETGHQSGRFYADQDGQLHLNSSSLYVDESGTALSGAELAALDAKVLDTLAVAAPVVGTSTTAGSATQVTSRVIKKTGIADNTATDVITVTVPNANAAAAIRLTIVGSLGTGTDTFESTRVAVGTVVIARQAGANAVATAVALTNAGIATVSGGGTLTLAYDLGSVSGAVGATNTFTIRVTLVKTGTITDLQAVIFAEVINAEASGVTIAAS